MAATNQSSPGMAPPPVALAERADVHKSCKSVESLLGIFNEYCEAVGVISALQKRLAKALRETAGMRGTREIAVQTMTASAAIFEALAEVDTKFSKVADKEYDSVSTEVKKWFKKLAKDERNHDERLANANAKIKQAGQNYEKKSKKKTVDVSEEHARYINLISTLGPEMAQEKYNHSLNVTQRHSSTIYSVAACLSRLADSEWHKSCECVRRFSPTIGPLGQWKALCEGGWTGAVPADLPNIESGSPTDERASSGGLKPIQEETNAQPQTPGSAQHTPETRELELPRANLPPGYSSGPPSASASAQDLHREHVPLRSSPTPPKQIQAANLSPPEHSGPTAAHVDPNTGSVRSLSAFPSPPTHFPIPPLRPQPQQSSLSQSLTASSNLQFPSSGSVLAESPVSVHSELDDSFRTANQNFRDSNSSSSPSIMENRPKGHTRASDEEIARISSTVPSSAHEIRRPIPVKSHTSLPAETNYRREQELAAPQLLSHRPSSSADLTALRSHRAQHEEENKEFGVLHGYADISPGKSRTMDGYKYPRSMERTDTGTSTGSLVAAMRNRYSNTSGSTSPPPRDLPRIPLSVNDLASRYEPNEAPLSPRLRAVSPPVTRQQSLPLLDTAARAPKESHHERISPSVNRHMLGPEDDRRFRQQQQQQRSEDVAVLERKVKEQELQAREQELDMRSRELERERARLQSLRDEENALQPQFALRPRERRTSLRHQLQRPLSQMDLGNGPDNTANVSSGPSNPRQKPYASAQLAPPPVSPVKPLASPKRSQHSPLPSPRMDTSYDSRHQRERDRHAESPISNASSAANTSHASNCGCETCSVSKYGAPAHQRVDSKPDKPKSWMRRLSMPVGNALGLDSAKRNQGAGLPGGMTNFSLGSGVGNTPVGGRGIFSMDGKKNASTTALSSRSPDMNSNGTERGLGVREDGRVGAQTRGGLLPGRKSYEASGISNRSMTNLGITGRH